MSNPTESSNYSLRSPRAKKRQRRSVSAEEGKNKSRRRKQKSPRRDKNFDRSNYKDDIRDDDPWDLEDSPPLAGCDPRMLKATNGKPRRNSSEDLSKMWRGAVGDSDS